MITANQWAGLPSSRLRCSVPLPTPERAPDGRCRGFSVKLEAGGVAPLRWSWRVRFLRLARLAPLQ